MNTKTILLSAAVILAITPASAQLRPDWGAIDRVMRDNPPAPQPVPRSQLPNGSTGNGCLGFGRGVVAMVNQIADSLNVEGSELTSPQVARDAVDTTAEARWRQMRQNLIGQHQRSEQNPAFHSVCSAPGLGCPLR